MELELALALLQKQKPLMLYAELEDYGSSLSFQGNLHAQLVAAINYARTKRGLRAQLVIHSSLVSGEETKEELQTYLEGLVKQLAVSGEKFSVSTETLNEHNFLITILT